MYPIRSAASLFISAHTCTAALHEHSPDADLRFKRRSSTGKMKRKFTLSSIFPGQSVGVKG
ncbi:hypothetical protein SARC_11904, partial [Sphaeroforma arctica JP610]